MKKLLHSLAFVTATAAAGSAFAGVTFYEADNFIGQPLATNGVIADMRAYNFNDRAMSMVVQGSPVEVCADINFSGQCQVFMPGEYPKLIDQGWTHVISSVRPAPSAAYNQHYGQGQAYQYDPRTNDPRYGYPADPRYGYPADQRGYQGGGSTQGYRDRWYNPRDRGGGF